MKRELASTLVEARLLALHALHRPESVEVARRRLDHERPRANVSLDRSAARALDELRSLLELTRHLHLRRR